MKNCLIELVHHVLRMQAVELFLPSLTQSQWIVESPSTLCTTSRPQ